MSQSKMTALLHVMAALRNPETGCPWDREQNFSSIAAYTIEEAYEVADAIKKNDRSALCDELGDLLLQVVYHARIAEERGWFDFNDVVTGITDKMIRRHPHVFGNADRGDTADQTESWETEKARERHRRTEFSALDGIAGTLPAMLRAQKLARRAARVGFDWPDVAAVLDKLDEEIAELRAELPRPAATSDLNRIEDEIGDIFFVLVNLARKLHVSSESALTRANAKFERRFRAVEAILTAAGETPENAGLKEMEDLWRRVKLSER